MRPTLRLPTNRYLRLVLVVAGVTACILGIRATATLGLSRLFARYALVMRNPDAARTATELTPRDPHAQITAATLSSLVGLPGESMASVEKAVALRPADYTLWIALGQARDQMGDTAGALAAFDQAVQRAPYYSKPYWQRGNLLLRAGQYEAAFKDLNHAAQSNPELIPRLVDLAWVVSKHDPALAESIAEIQSPKRRIAFAQLLVRAGKSQEAVAQWKAAGAVGEEIQRQFIQQLLAEKAYADAFVLWKAARGGADALIDDGGFEGPLVLSEEGFGWRVPADLKGISLSLDATDRHSGGKSIVITYQGDSAPSSATLSQLVLVQPSSRYKLNFAARSRDIVSGGPPVVTVDDAVDQKPLAQSSPLNKGTSAWQVFSVEFNTSATTTAVLVSLKREGCTTSPCPIFGSLSLDSFSLERLK